MASIRKRGNKYFIDYRVNGKRVRRSVGASFEEAVKIQKEIESKLTSIGKESTAEDFQLNHLFDKFKDFSRNTHSPNTQARYNSIISNFKRFILVQNSRLTCVSEVKPDLVEGFISFRKNEGAKSHTINAELSVLKKIFRLAISWKLVEDNPFESITPLILPKKQQPKILTRIECRKLIDVCPQWLYPIIFTFLNTGLRKGELERLRWKDIDLDQRIISVVAHDAWTPTENERVIPINKKLHDVLKKLKTRTGHSSFVFLDQKLRPLDRNVIRLSLIKIAKQADLTDVTKVITLRHTFIHQLIEKGVDLAVVKKIVGHSDFHTTLAYQKYQKNHIQNAVEGLDL